VRQSLQTVGRPTCVAGTAQHLADVGTDGKSCSCYSASPVPTVNNCSKTGLLQSEPQKNSPQQTTDARTVGRCSERENICSGRLYGSKQQQGLAVGWIETESTLTGQATARMRISQHQAKSASKSHITAHSTLAEKIEHLRSRGFLIDGCNAVENAFLQFIELLYSFQDIFCIFFDRHNKVQFIEMQYFYLSRL